VAMVLHNLGSLQCTRNDQESAEAWHRQALEIYRELAEKHPETYLPKVAVTLSNLGILQSDLHYHDSAEASHRETLAVYRELAAMHPETYLPDVVISLLNLSVFYYNYRPIRDTSIAYVREAMTVLQSLVPHTSATEGYLETARQILDAWEVEDDE